MEEYNDFIGPTPDQPPNDYDQYNRRHQQYSRSHSEEEEQIECNSQNFFAISAIFRMFFLIFAIIGIFASLLSKFQDDNGFFTSYVTLRIAYLVISTTIFAYEALILILDIINFFNLPQTKKLPINIILLIVDCLLLFGVLICSIFAFIKAEYIHQEMVITPWGPIVASSYFSAHAFFVMSIFGYLMSMLFVEEIIFLIFQIFAKFLADRKADRNRKRHSYY